MSTELNFHDLSEAEQDKARPYMELINAIAFMKSEAILRFPDNLEEVLEERKTLPECDDAFINDVIKAREYDIRLLEVESINPDSDLYKYAGYEYTFEYTYKSDMEAIKEDLDKLSRLFISILKDRWDETDLTSPTPQITQIVSMDNKLVYMINNITSIRSIFEHMNM